MKAMIHASCHRGRVLAYSTDTSTISEKAQFLGKKLPYHSDRNRRQGERISDDVSYGYALPPSPAIRYSRLFHFP